MAHKNYYAHLSNNRRELLIDHLTETGKLAEKFAFVFGCGKLGLQRILPRISQTAGRINRNDRSRQSSSRFFSSCAKVQNIQHALRKAAFTEHTIENLIPLNQCCFFHPRATSSVIITLNPTAKKTVPKFECFPCDISGISSSTTT